MSHILIRADSFNVESTQLYGQGQQATASSKQVCCILRHTDAHVAIFGTAITIYSVWRKRCPRSAD